MSGRNLRPVLPLSLAVLGLAIAPAAQAASTSVNVGAHSGDRSGDRSTLRLSNASKRALSRHHVRTQVMSPATHPGAQVYFPQTSGKWSFTKATGTLSYAGAFRLRDGKRSVTLTELSFTRALNDTSSVTTRIGKRELTLFTLTGGTRVKNQGTRETLTGFTAHLTKQSAQRLNAALHHRVVSKNENVGSFAITVSKTAKSSPTGPSGPVGPGAPGSGGTPGVGVSFGSGLEQVLSAHGLGALPIAPATLPGTDGSSIALPEGAGGSFDAGTLTGSIPLSGGIQLGSGSGAIRLTNAELSLGTGTAGSSLSFAVNGGPEVKVFDVDTSQLEKSTTANGNLDISGLVARLSSEGASTLNAVAGTDLVQPGEAAGGLTVVVPASSGIK